MSTAPSRLLPALLILSLTACATRSTPPTTPPLPPRVDCQQPPAPEPERPRTWDLAGLSEALASALGALTEERRLSRVEDECHQRLRDRGVIR